MSVAGAANDEQLEPLFGWFLRNLRLAQSANRASRIVRTSEIVQDPSTKNRAMSLVRSADLGICDIERARSIPMSQSVSSAPCERFKAGCRGRS
ncbi:MAG: hypothetical protein H6512_12570 [Acidimicrobiia bacterium]|nr:hypothetical protein [Acidimicrobiia bacterium]